MRNQLMKKYNLSETMQGHGLVAELNLLIEEVIESRPINIYQFKRLCEKMDIKVIITKKNGIMLQLRDESPIYSSKLQIFNTKEHLFVNIK